MSPVRGPNNEAYSQYYQSWSQEQQRLSNELSDGLQKEISEDQLRELVRKVKAHYKEYYAAKHGAAKQDVLKMMHPKWRSPLEVAFLWIGGWRPTMIFQLAYAQAGRHVEADLADFLNGLDTPSLNSLSAKQFSDINKLQIQKQKAEEVLAHREAVIQQSLGDHPLQLLVGSDPNESESGKRSNSMSEMMEEKVKALEELMCDADTLRFESLTEFLDILTTVQAAQYLVAAGELHVAVQEIGKQREKSMTD